MGKGQLLAVLTRRPGQAMSHGALTSGKLVLGKVAEGMHRKYMHEKFTKHPHPAVP